MLAWHHTDLTEVFFPSKMCQVPTFSYLSSSITKSISIMSASASLSPVFTGNIRSRSVVMSWKWAFVRSFEKEAIDSFLLEAPGLSFPCVNN